MATSPANARRGRFCFHGGCDASVVSVPGAVSLIAASPRGAPSFGLPSDSSSLKEGELPGSRADALMFPPPHNATRVLVPRLFSLPVSSNGKCKSRLAQLNHAL